MGRRGSYGEERELWGGEGAMGRRGSYGEERELCYGEEGAMELWGGEGAREERVPVSCVYMRRTLCVSGCGC